MSWRRVYDKYNFPRELETIVDEYASNIFPDSFYVKFVDIMNEIFLHLSIVDTHLIDCIDTSILLNLQKIQNFINNNDYYYRYFIYTFYSLYFGEKLVRFKFYPMYFSYDLHHQDSVIIRDKINNLLLEYKEYITRL